MRGLAGLAMAFTVCGSAMAQDQVIQDHHNSVCVVCESPDQTYRCRADAADPHKLFLQNRELVRLACIKDIADSRGHSGCRAPKDQPTFCAGQPYAVNLTDLAQKLTRGLPIKIERPSERQPPKPAKPADAGEPKTVVDLAKQTAKQTQEQIEGAGEAVKNAGKVVGGTVQKTWQCLTSLFQDC